jgi:hypothetical protein
MSDIPIALVQVAVLVALGHRTGHRLLLAVAALSGAAGSIWLRHPDPMSTALTDVATTTVGIVVGAALGWWAIRARERRLSASGRQRTLLSTAAERAREASRRRIRVRAMASLAAFAAAAAALHHFEHERMNALYAAVQARWVALVAPAPAAKAPAARGAAVASSGAPSGPPGARRTAVTEGPRGDLRHCLDLAGPSDVLRCAER